MKKATFIATLLALCTASSIRAQSDSIRLDEIVVTGIQSRVSRDNLPSTTTVITRREIEESGQPSLLSALSGRVPGLFITERGLLGFGVGSTSAGAINLRGIGDGTRLLVLIDGNPQYMGIMGHHLPDAYTSAAVERVEITRAPASLVGGSNAMGGAINIITRGAGKEGWSGGASLSFGAYDTRALQAHAAGKGDGWETFLSLENSHTDGHRAGKSARFHLTAGHAKLALRLTPLLRLAGSVNLSLYETQNPGLLADPILDNVGDILRGVANISLENRWKHGHGALALFYNFGDHEINEGY
jgi:iron complex outermembrane receptor protein